MNNEENDNHILIEVLNKNGDLKLTKFRNPRVIFQNNDYPDEYIFRDVYIVNIFQLQQEKQELKKELEEKNKPQIFIDTQDIEERYAEGLYQDYLEEENKKYKNQQKEFVEYLEKEKYRLAGECSQIYEDSLGKIRLVNTDIVNEVDKILSKYEDIIDK